MKIQKILRQHRRDFQAIYECEHCGHTFETYGYDDAMRPTSDGTSPNGGPVDKYTAVNLHGFGICRSGRK